MSRDPTPDIDVSLNRIGVILEDVATALESIVKAIDSKKTVVPLFIFIPSTNMREDELAKLSAFMRHAWAEANGETIEESSLD